MAFAVLGSVVKYAARAGCECVRHDHWSTADDVFEPAR